MYGSHFPFDARSPRESTATTAYPFASWAAAPRPEAFFPYGVIVSNTGNGPFPWGRYTSAPSGTPSRIGIETFAWVGEVAGAPPRCADESGAATTSGMSAPATS